MRRVILWHMAVNDAERQVADLLRHCRQYYNRSNDITDQDTEKREYHCKHEHFSVFSVPQFPEFFQPGYPHAIIPFLCILFYVSFLVYLFS